MRTHSTILILYSRETAKHTQSTKSEWYLGCCNHDLRSSRRVLMSTVEREFLRQHFTTVLNNARRSVAEAAGVCFDCNYVHLLHSVNKFLASALCFQVHSRIGLEAFATRAAQGREKVGNKSRHSWHTVRSQCCRPSPVYVAWRALDEVINWLRQPEHAG